MSKILFFTTIFVLIFGIIDSAKFKDCGSEIGRFVDIRVSKCRPSSKVCELKRSKNATIEIDFELVGADYVENVQTVVNGIIFDTEIPFPLERPDACSNSGLSCPLTRDKMHRYIQTLPVKIYYPPVSVTVKWELKDTTSDRTIVCVLIPARITLF